MSSTSPPPTKKPKEETPESAGEGDQEDPRGSPEDDVELKRKIAKEKSEQSPNGDKSRGKVAFIGLEIALNRP